MTTVAVLVDPPRPGLVFPRLPETSPLSAEAAASLYAALTKDVLSASVACGGEFLVNYRSEEDLDVTAKTSAEAELRDVVADVIDPGEVRFERQVGETFSGRAGNTATHLLESEGVGSAAIVEPSAAFLARTEIDGAAMKLRSSEVVVGPATGGRVYYAGFTEPIDFAGAYDPPAVETLTERGRDAGLGVDFLPHLPVVETGRDLAAAVTLLRARRRADRLVPEHFAAWLADSDLRVEVDDNGPVLVN